VARNIMDRKSSIRRFQNSVMKRGGTVEGGRKSPGQIIARQIPGIPEDEIVVLFFRLKRFQPEGDFMKGFVP
jgi:hypothetical protein